MVVTPSEPRGARRVRHYGVVICLNTFANEIQAYYLKRASRSDARTGFVGRKAGGWREAPSRLLDVRRIKARDEIEDLHLYGERGPGRGKGIGSRRIEGLADSQKQQFRCRGVHFLGPFLDLHLRPYMEQVWDPKWTPKWTGLGPQIDLQMDEIWNPKCIANVSQMGPQMEPKWTRNRTANRSQLDY